MDRNGHWQSIIASSSENQQRKPQVAASTYYLQRDEHCQNLMRNKTLQEIDKTISTAQVNLPAQELQRANSKPGKIYFPPQGAIPNALRVKGCQAAVDRGGEVQILPG